MLYWARPLTETEIAALVESGYVVVWVTVRVAGSMKVRERVWLPRRSWEMNSEF
jgi:hypothetical protein